jgi:hypothetical protein
MTSINEGIVRYSTNYCWVEVDKELGRLYRKLFLRDYGIKLQAPSNGEHISVITEWDSVPRPICQIYEGKIVYFSLLNQLYTNGNAVWLDIESPELLELRDLWGLGKPDRNLHMCIGYQYNY